MSEPKKTTEETTEELAKRCGTAVHGDGHDNPSLRVDEAEACELLALACIRLRELQAVVDEYPHSADGAPVTPGMKLYPKHPIPGLEDDHGVVTIGIYDPATMAHHVHGYDGFRTGACYSTRDAALAALDNASEVGEDKEGDDDR